MNVTIGVLLLLKYCGISSVLEHRTDTPASGLKLKLTKLNQETQSFTCGVDSRL
ncbi:MAG: hypothetical protein U7127_11990 [Phormidium sp.]